MSSICAEVYQEWNEVDFKKNCEQTFLRDFEHIIFHAMPPITTKNYYFISWNNYQLTWWPIGDQLDNWLIIV